ncbi:MAG: LON peptidase substrate-binding domain-containing protein [Caulobacteraceae bacterium]
MPPAPAYLKAADLPQVLPVFPLDGAILLPQGALPLNIFEPRYLNMIDDVMGAERMIGMVQTRPGGDPERPHLAQVGCAGRITSFSETGDGRYIITLTGICRFNVGAELPGGLPYRQVRADFTPYEADLKPMAEDEGFDQMRLLAALKHYLDQRGMEIDWETAKSAPCEALVNSLCMALPFEPPEKQAFLEAATTWDRREALVALLEIGAAASGDDETPQVQ